MRVWILEDTPEYEQATRVGVYVSALAAWDDLFTQVNDRVFSLWKFDMYVGGDENEQGDTRAILVRVRYNSGDEVTLRGEYVKGSAAGGGVAPTVGDWRDLQQVAGLLRQHAVQVVGFRPEEEHPNHLATGSWSFAKPDLPF